MTSDSKIKWVRDKIYEQEKLAGLGIAEYSLVPLVQEVIDSMDFLTFFEIENGMHDKTKKSVVVMTVDEQITILKQLEKDGLIKILELKPKSALLEVMPLLPSPIKLKTLEHIAQALANTCSGSQMVNTLLDYGIPRADIPYPDTKWRTLQNMFLFLATSPNPKQREKFGGAITVFLHPLNFGADESASNKLIEDFNKYLKFDGYEITVADDGDGYKLATTKNRTKVTDPIEKLEVPKAKITPDPSYVLPISSTFDLNNIDNSEELKFPTDAELEEKYSKQVEYETGILQQPKVTDHLAVMRESYKTLMAIVSSFCVDPTTPSRDLNVAYVELSKLIREGLDDFCGDTSEFEIFCFDEYKGDNFGIPFTGLYSAELEFKKKNRQMHWNEIRPTMNAVLGQIEELCQTANSPEIISEPKTQKIISDAMLILSKIAASRKGSSVPKTEKTVRMEITKMPEMVVRNPDDTSIIKGKKRLRLPKFTATDWAKITIRFTDERTVLITADKKEQVPSDYEALGFSDDKRNKPNTAWGLLLSLAKNNGETKELPLPIPDNIKQHKRQLSDRLKTIFKNDTDPFYDPTETRTYRIKITLIPPYSETTKLFQIEDTLSEIE